MNTERTSVGVEFINHACVIIAAGAARILCDPWLSGAIFDNGWDLLVETGQTIGDLDFTHLWISHEHPDHFSPAELKRLPEDRRRRTPLFYHETRDGKVLSFCRNLGYPAKELAPFEPCPLGEEVMITSGLSAGYDSWLHIRCPGGSILNLNDCQLHDPDQLQGIKRRLGEIDLLMTQFSYANWVGNPGDHRGAERARARVFAQIKAQIDYLKPHYVLPFASFIWFSHEENSFWNEMATRIDWATERLLSFGAQPIVLYPGDAWRLGERVDKAPALARWNAAYSAIHHRPRHSGKAVPLADLQADFAAMQVKLQQANDWGAIVAFARTGGLPPTPIYLHDLSLAVSFDIINGLSVADLPAAECDVEMASGSLAYILKYAWGRNTVTINARFKARYETLWRFFRQTQIYHANNIGKSFPADIGPDELQNPESFILKLLSSDKEARESA